MRWGGYGSGGRREGNERTHGGSERGIDMTNCTTLDNGFEATANMNTSAGLIVHRGIYTARRTGF